MALQDLKNQLTETLQGCPAGTWGDVDVTVYLSAIQIAGSYWELTACLVELERAVFQEINGLAATLDKSQSVASLYEKNDPALKNIEALDKMLAMANALASEHCNDMIIELGREHEDQYEQITTISNNMGAYNNAPMENSPGRTHFLGELKKLLLFNYIKCLQMGELNADFVASMASAITDICPEYRNVKGEIAPKFGLHAQLDMRNQGMACERDIYLFDNYYTPSENKAFTPAMAEDYSAYMSQIPQDMQLSEQTYANIVDIDHGEAYAAPVKFKFRIMVDSKGPFGDFYPSNPNESPVQALEGRRVFEERKHQLKDQYMKDSSRDLGAAAMSGMLLIPGEEGNVSYIPATILILHESTHVLHHFSGTARSKFTEAAAPEMVGNEKWAGSSGAPVEEQQTTNNFSKSGRFDRFSEKSLTEDARFLVNGAYVGRTYYDQGVGTVVVAEFAFMKSNDLRAAPYTQAIGGATAMVNEDDDDEPTQNLGCGSITACFTSQRSTMG